MTRNTMLTASSVLSVLLFTLHLADDIVLGFETGRLANLGALPIFVLWLYGALVLGERRSGHAIMLVGALLALAVPVLHMQGRGVGVGSAVGGSSGAFRFVWTLVAIGVTSLLSVVLAAHGLWDLRRGPHRAR